MCYSIDKPKLHFIEDFSLKGSDPSQFHFMRLDELIKTKMPEILVFLT